MTYVQTSRKVPGAGSTYIPSSKIVTATDTISRGAESVLAQNWQQDTFPYTLYFISLRAGVAKRSISCSVLLTECSGELTLLLENQLRNVDRETS